MYSSMSSSILSYRFRLMTASTLNARDIARYFLANVDEEGGDNITNLKLQKLLYYAQGFHVALQSGQPLFPESILAWSHGPVVKSIYSEHKHLLWRPIARPSAYRVDGYPPEVRELLDTVSSTYGQFTASKLEAMTHEEPPWQNTPKNKIISLDLLSSFFSTLVEAGRRNQAVHGEPLWPTNSLRYQRRTEISNRMAAHRAKLRTLANKSPIAVDP